jgi:2'-5' RNA ligase
MPDAARAELRPVLTRLASDDPRPRWVPVENLHLTLVFLGDTDADEVPAILRAIRTLATGQPPFDIRLGGIGTFGGRRRPQVLWMGLEAGAETVAGLAESLAAALRPEELGGAERPAHRPHLTLARGGSRDLVARAGAALGEHRPTWRADRIELLRSHIGTGPARYEVLGTVPLGAG